MADVKSKFTRKDASPIKPKENSKSLKSEISQLLKLLVDEKRKKYQSSNVSSTITKASGKTDDYVTMRDVMEAEEQDFPQ